MSAQRKIFIALSILVVGALAYWMWPAQKADTTGGKAGRGGQATSVTTAVARIADLPIRLRSIGWVEPVQRVSVSTRLNSQIAEQHVVEGQIVKKDELLFKLDDREVRAAIARDTANLARDRATLARAQADLRRGQDLVAKGFLSKQVLDQRTADAKTAQATVDADQAALNADRVQLTYTEIHAPIAGRAGAVSITPGNLVRTSDTAPLVTITQMAPVWVSFTLPERDLATLRAAMSKPGGKGPETRAMLADDKQPRATGRVTFLDSAVDQSTGTIAVKATMPNANQELWPGQYVNVEVDVGVRPHAVIIPTVALQSGQNGQYVYLIGPDSKAIARQVQVAGSDGELSAISTGLAAGDQVVIEGQQRLTDGARVKAVPAGAKTQQQAPEGSGHGGRSAARAARG
ncbi:MAG: efflux RND transporter periplasmic adaptor subunit [Alphaproteobacteria bacterium]|nr:efflux RND transporter periplasmic adaptor subunit [Alphaproteobacteria bacterium]